MESNIQYHLCLEHSERNDLRVVVLDVVGARFIFGDAARATADLTAPTRPTDRLALASDFLAAALATVGRM